MVLYHHTKNFKKTVKRFQSYIKRSIFGSFLPNLGKTGIFPKNLAHSLFHLYGLLSSCKISEKNIKRFTSNNHLKNPAIWLVKSFKLENSRTRIFLDMWMVSSDFLHYGAHFRTFSAKTNDRILKYNQKGQFLDHFGNFWPKQEFSRKIGLCHFFCIMDL